MRTFVFASAMALCTAGCLGTYTPGGDPGPLQQGAGDMARAGGGGGGSGGNGPAGNSSDMAMHQGGLPSSDMAGASPGAAAFGATCTLNADCQSLLCQPFVMGTVHRCTKPCTIGTQATDCPAPSAGTCTNNGYCKFSQ